MLDQWHGFFQPRPFVNPHDERSSRGSHTSKQQERPNQTKAKIDPCSISEPFCPSYRSRCLAFAFASPIGTKHPRHWARAAHQRQALSRPWLVHTL